MSNTKFYCHESETQAKKKHFFLTETAFFIRSLQKASGTPIKDLCKETSTSTSTYYKIMRCEPVKHECYQKLLIGLCHAATDEEFLIHWTLFGKGIYAASEATELL